MMNVFHGKVILKKKKKRNFWRINVHSLIMFLPVSQALSGSRTVNVGGNFWFAQQYLCHDEM